MTPTGARALVLVALFGSPTLAEAQVSRDPIAAEAAFDEARMLMKAGNYSEACPKFEASQRLDPGVGTLLNLGDCFEKNGQLASAWARFREAASAAVGASQSDREGIARARATALEGRLAKLTMRVPPGSDVNGLIVVRDGIALDRALWGLALPVDPGTHKIEASAPGKETWSTTLTAEVGPSAIVVDLPPLRDTHIAAVSAKAVSADPRVPPQAKLTPPEHAARSWGTQKTIAVSAFGAGVIGAAVGTAIALAARSSYAEARARCLPAGCGEEAIQMGRDAGRSADVATVVIVAGGVAVVGGVVLFLTAPSGGAPARSARILAEGLKF